MRRGTKNSLLAATVLLVTLAAAVPARARAAASTSGVTVSPATLTISLAKGEDRQQASFTVTNHYSGTVAFHFAFAQSVRTPGSDDSAVKQVSITPADLTLAAGGSATPVVTLTNSDRLSPGSQQIELVITQLATPGTAVSVVPSMRMPLIIIKQDGAVTSFAVSALGTPGFALGLPQTISLKLKNTGNMIAIPRGYISVESPGGRQVSKGVLNTASLAVAPGGQLRLETPMTLVDHPWPSGPYRVRVVYGPGGGLPAQSTAVRMMYIPVWQILLALVLAAMAYCIRLIWIEWAKARSARQTRPPTGQHRPLATGGVS